MDLPLRLYFFIPNILSGEPLINSINAQQSRTYNPTFFRIVQNCTQKYDTFLIFLSLFFEKEDNQ